MTFAGEVVHDNNRESLVMVYKELWLSDKQRKDMSEYGIASENLKKRMSGDDSASSTDKGDNSLFNARGKKIKIRLGKILKDRGLLASYGISNNVQYVLSLPSAKKIMVAQSGDESVEGYALRDVNLTYETIETSDLYSQALSEYADTDFPFEHITHSRMSNWGKDQTDVNETIARILKAYLHSHSTSGLSFSVSATQHSMSNHSLSLSGKLHLHLDHSQTALTLEIKVEFELSLSVGHTSLEPH